MSTLYRDTTLTKIFVGGLPYHTTDDSLQRFFDQFGPIEEAVVITDRHSGKSKGYGFVTMADRVGAERACKDPNPIIDGRKANVNLAYLGAKPRLQAGEVISECYHFNAFPINLKTGLTAAYPAHLSRVGPIFQQAPPAFITHFAPMPSGAHINGMTSSSTTPTLYPMSPSTPNGTNMGGLISYAPSTAFAFPVHPGYEASPPVTNPAFAPFSVIGYISPNNPNALTAPPFPSQPLQTTPTPGSPTAFLPTLHCLPQPAQQSSSTLPPPQQQIMH